MDLLEHFAAVRAPHGREQCACCEGDGAHGSRACQRCAGTGFVRQGSDEPWCAPREGDQPAPRRRHWREPRTAAIRRVPPEEYSNYRYPDYPAKTLPALARYFRRHEPDYYAAVHAHIAEHGVQEAMLVRTKDPRGKDLKRPYVMSGHHRAAAAYEQGQDMPVGDYDDQEDYDASGHDFAQQWWQEHHELKERYHDPRQAVQRRQQHEAGVEDYGIGHRPLSDGAPAHDLTQGYSEDIYTHPQYWAAHNPPERDDLEGFAQLLRARGKPEAKVHIWRASHKDAPHEINPGDWVTLSKTYAGKHAYAESGTDDPEGQYTVHHAVVPAKHVRDAGTDYYREQGYWGPPIACCGHGKTAARPGYGPREEYDDEASQRDPGYFEAYRDRKRAWSAHVKRGLSLGHLTAEQAKGHGYYFGGHETDHNGDPKWQALPREMYHATTDLPAVRQHGLRTRQELEQAHGGHGLGGGEDDTISVTTDHELGRGILRSLHEFHDVVNGRYTPQQMWEHAKAGTGASRPFHEDLMHYWDRSWKHGDPVPRGVHDALHGVHRQNEMGATQADMDAKGPGWRPAHGDEGWTTGHTPPRQAHAYWERDMTPDENRENASEFYKKFAAFREHAGGREDPNFFMTDEKAFAAKDPSKFALLHVRPRPGGHGYPMGGMREWRTGTGDALEVHHYEHAEPQQHHEGSVINFEPYSHLKFRTSAWEKTSTASTESVRHMLDHYRPYDFDTWDEVRHNINWHTPELRAFVDDVRRNGVKRPIPVDYEQDPPQVKNGHTRLLAAERAGIETVPVRQHEFMDPDDPDPTGRQESGPYLRPGDPDATTRRGDRPIVTEAARRTWFAVGPALSFMATDLFHGSDRDEPFSRFDFSQRSLKSEDEEESPLYKQEGEGKTTRWWNSRLGSHFTSEHHVASEIAQRMGGGGNVYHVDLRQQNPKHYASEHDLAEEGVTWARKQGYKGLRNLGFSWDQGGWHHAEALQNHPKAQEIAEGFRAHLQGQGYDGITYGNEYEGTKGHLSAIAFHPDQAKITETHGGHDPCRYDEDTSHEASRHTAADQLPPGYAMEVQEEEETHWGHPALHLKVNHEGKPVAGLGVFQRPDPETGSLVGNPNVWVYPEHQRKGLGTAMYAEVHRRWPGIPMMHSPHQSDDAQALNQTLKERFGPDLHYGHLSAEAVLPLRNPHTGGRDWYHGTMASPEELKPHGFADPSSVTPLADMMPDSETEGGHWNSLLGTHFTADHDVAKAFAGGEHSSGANERHGDWDDGEFGEPHRGIVHARLGLKNPKVYDSEHDMDHEAYEHEFAAHNHPSNHVPGIGKPGDADETDDEELYEAEEMWHHAHRIAKDYGHNKIPASTYGHMRTQFQGHPMRTAWLNTHPDKYDIAMRFKKRLQDQGHDGVIYGNEYERSKRGREANKSAIAFDPDQIHVTQHHEYDSRCDPEPAEHEAARDISRIRLKHEPPIISGHWERDEQGAPTNWVDTDPAQGHHMLTALAPNNRTVGWMHWDKGVVRKIDVNDSWQRSGLGRRMWERASEITPGLSHSDNRTDEGQGFAKAVGGPLPERVQDHPEWFHEARYITEDEARAAARAAAFDWSRLTHGRYDVPTEAVHALRQHEQTSSGKHPRLAEEVAERGIEDPLEVSLHDDGRVVLRGGSHRVNIAHGLGHPTVPVQVVDMRTRHEAAVFVPTQRIFGPTSCLDHRLFDGKQMKPEVRSTLLERLRGVLEPLLGESWDLMTRAYLAGSEASLWTSKNCEGNGDLDVLVGAACFHIRLANPELAQLTDEQIERRLNAALREHFNASPWDPPFEGTYDLTGFVNHDALDIKRIRPYAAYDLTLGTWAVEPPDLPDWGPEQFPQGPAVFQQGRALIAEVRAILRLPEPFKTQEAKRIWQYIHEGRRAEFTEEGMGWQGTGNVLEKMLDQATGKLVEKLKALVYAEQPSGPMALGHGMTTDDLAGVK